MKKLQQLFRNSYRGEEVSIEGSYKESEWTFQKEFIENTVNNARYFESAVIIGNGVERTKFDLNRIKNHLGTKLGVKTLQTYGCNALYRDFTPNFLVVTGKKIAAEVPRSYTEQHVTYAPINRIIEHPGKFNLIPQTPDYNAGAIAAYLAAFDGHTRIFLLGFDHNDDPAVNNNVYAGTNGYANYNQGQNDAFWTECLYEVIRTYPAVDWVLVKETGRGYIPEKLKYTSLRVMSFYDFILSADL